MHTSSGSYVLSTGDMSYLFSIARERNIIARERDLFARERDLFAREPDIIAREREKIAFPRDRKKITHVLSGAP